MSAPAALASQNPRLGRSWAKIAAAAAVASGRMPSTTPPWAAGTVIIASAANSGNPTTVHNAAPNISSQSDRDGAGRRRATRTTSPADPASAARATVRNSGSNPDTASRVAGSVPANRHMPRKPSNNPSFFWEIVTAWLVLKRRQRRHADERPMQSEQPDIKTGRRSKAEPIDLTD